MTQPPGGSVAVPDQGETAQAEPSGPKRAVIATLALTMVAVVAIDLFTKQLALDGLSDGHAERLLGGLVYLDLTRNSGAAFSIGANFTFVFPLVAMVVVGAILFFIRRVGSTTWALALGLIAGGALGNLLDRLFRAPGPLQGHVVDFISVFAPAGQRFPIFNAADSALFCGVVVAMALEFTGRRWNGTRATPEPTPDPATADRPSGVRDSQRDEA